MPKNKFYWIFIFCVLNFVPGSVHVPPLKTFKKYAVICRSTLDLPGKWSVSNTSSFPFIYVPLQKSSCAKNTQLFDNYDALTACIANKFILFIGDSVDYGAFEFMCSFLRGDSLLHCPLFGYSQCKTLDNTQILIHTLICGSHDGPYFHQCASRFHSSTEGREWNHTMTSHILEMRYGLTEIFGKPPDLVSIHFGVWDLATKWQYGGGNTQAEKWFDNYPEEWVRSARNALHFIKLNFPVSTLIFRGIGPTVESRLKLGSTELDRLKMRFVQPIASAAKLLCVEEGIRYADFFTMMLGMDEFSRDGFHWDGKAMSFGILNLIFNEVLC